MIEFLDNFTYTRIPAKKPPKKSQFVTVDFDTDHIMANVKRQAEDHLITEGKKEINERIGHLKCSEGKIVIEITGNIDGAEFRVKEACDEHRKELESLLEPLDSLES